VLTSQIPEPDKEGHQAESAAQIEEQSGAVSDSLAQAPCGF
jgi:hypothetical protein